MELKIVGQHNVINTFDELIQSNKLPRFFILSGCKGSGKHTLCNYIAKKCGIDVVFYDNTIDDIRKCMDLVYSYTQPIIVVLCDADSMHISTKNSILKLTEEPPLNTYIVLLCESKESLLDTIRTRGQVFELDSYTPDELMEFCSNTFPTRTEQDCRLLCSVCSCPGDIIEYQNVDVQSLMSYCDLILDKLWSNELSGVLKIPASFFVKETKPELKKNDFSPELVTSTLIKKCLDRVRNNLDDLQGKRLYYDTMRILCKYRVMMSRKGVSTQRVLDNMYIEVWNLGHSKT